MTKYHVEFIGNGEIRVFRDNTTIAESICGNLYPTTEAKDFIDIDTLYDIADCYGLFYIERGI